MAPTKNNNPLCDKWTPEDWASYHIPALMRSEGVFLIKEHNVIYTKNVELEISVAKCRGIPIIEIDVD